jgi:hypothetical protein
MPSQDPVSIVENFLDVSYPVSPLVSEAWKTVKELAQRSDNSASKTLPTFDEYVEWSRKRNLFAVSEIYQYLTGNDLA